MNYYVVGFEKEHHRYKNLITIDCIPNWLERLFFIKRKTRKYLGSGTVWYEVVNDSLKRCGTLTDSWLTSINQEQIYKSEKGE